LAKVNIRISPSLSGMMGVPRADWIVLQREITETATVREMLMSLATDNRDIGKLLKSQSCDIGEQVEIVLNNKLLLSPDLRETRLHDGDSIMLIPVYAGG
jgi:molybdopterin converting factor small subunit